MMQKARHTLTLFPAWEHIPSSCKDIHGICAVNLIPENPGKSLYAQSVERDVSFYDLVAGLASRNWSLFETKVQKYKPALIVTLGKPVFLAFSRILKLGLGWNREIVGTAIPIRISGLDIIWIPCVHIRTYGRHKYYRLVQPERLGHIGRINGETRRGI